MNQNNRFRNRNVETFADQIRRARIAKQNRNLQNFFINNGLKVNNNQRSRRQYSLNRNERNSINRQNFTSNRRPVLAYENRNQMGSRQIRNRVTNNGNQNFNRNRMISQVRQVRQVRQKNPQSNNSNIGRQRIGFINRNSQNYRIKYRNYNNFADNQNQNSRPRPRPNQNIQMKRTQVRVNRRIQGPRVSQNKVSIENIGVDTNNSELAEIFSPYGKIIKCSIIYDENNRSTGKGIVEFDNADSAKLAKNDLNGKFMLIINSNRNIVERLIHSSI